MNPLSTFQIIQKIPTVLPQAATILSLIFLQFSAPGAPVRPSGTIGYLQQLNEEDWILKAEALHYLSENKVPEALESILKITKDEKERSWIRSRALVAYCKIQNSQDIPQTLSTFASSSDPVLREGAAESAGLINGNKGVDISLKLTADKIKSVQLRALASYSRIMGEKAWPLAQEMTESLAEELIPLAVESLALIGNQEALERLKELTKSSTNKRALIESLSRSTNPKVLPVLLNLLENTSTDDANFAYVISALSKNNNEILSSSLKDLIRTGRDSALFVAARIITILFQDPDLGKELLSALTTTSAPETLEAVMIALGSKEMNPDSNTEFFITHLKNETPEIKILSIRCLSHCKEANLYTLLKETIKDDESGVSIAAINALMEAPLEDAPTGTLVSYLEDVLVSTDNVIRKAAFELLGHAGNADDFEPALAMLGEALSGTDTVRREAVAEALGSIAPDNGIANVARRQGYVSNWMVLGTFLNDKEHKAFANELEPEKGIDFEKTYPSTYVWALQGNQRRDGEKPIEREIGWSEASVNKTNGMLMMGPLLPPPGTFSIAYAVSDFNSEKDQDLFLSLDGDDAFKVWLNGEKISEQVAPYLHRQSCIASQGNIKIKLKKGKNRILVKSANIEHEWWVRARITDANNKPVELF
ncbi:MAG: HEAT repeat domain-containing protein [Verrucomicrobiaceae bacterium]|nr:MAG: HEAT repeat domain-containing protein [Verrucomicrobiaceae bacterium]